MRFEDFQVGDLIQLQPHHWAVKELGLAPYSIFQLRPIPGEIEFAVADPVTQFRPEEVGMVKRLKPEAILDLIGDFSYCWGYHFFIETEQGNFTWSDPGYDGGTGEIQSYQGSLASYCKQLGVPFARCKGKHIIREYCSDVLFA